MVALSATRAIEGEGTEEREWQRWLMASPCATHPVDHWLADRQRLVVVAPHPDDEVLACGGLIALHAARGGETLVIAVSDGEASHAGVPGWEAPRLADARRAESAEGLQRLGAGHAQVLRLCLPDGRVSAHLDDLPGLLAGVLQGSDVVVTTWRLDGHPDHESTGLATARACQVAGCRLMEAPVWMWHWAAPGDLRVPWHRLASVALDAPTVQRKQNALAAHTSQLQVRDARRGAVLGEAIRARAAWSAEYFFA